jgi:transposase InsO family protein
VTERELARGAARRLAIIRHVQEVTGNVALTCPYYGITRQCSYVWFRRYEEFGVEGLRDRSSRPHLSPRTTREEVIGKIIYLRQNYHFGPHKIAMYLERYHEIKVSTSGIWRILKRLDMSHLPASQRYKRHKECWKRYEKPQPGHRVQVDVKFVAPIGGTRKEHSQFTAIDDCTRLRVLRVYDHLNQKTAIQFIDDVFEKLPALPGRGGPDRQRRGVPVCLPLARPRPRRPARVHHAGHAPAQRQGRTITSDDADEFYRLLDGVVLDDARLFTAKLQEWEDFYNFDRPHGGLGGQTPYERLRQKTGALV